MRRETTFHHFNPRVHMKECFLNSAPPGAKTVAVRSGYMNLKTLCCSSCSHCSYRAVQFCKESGIHLLTLPPHTSHKTQPLDRTVFGPQKTYWHKSLDNWMRSNPGRFVSIYETSALSNQPFTLSMTSENVISGFRCTGIHPLNSMVFSDHEFAAASVTNQPLPVEMKNCGRRYRCHSPRHDDACGPHRRPVLRR